MEIYTKNQPEELAKVILCYPNEIIEPILETIHSEMNRGDSRGYNPIKSLDKKIIFILVRGVHRTKLFKELYRKFCGEPPECGFESVSDILDKCNYSNHLQCIAYFLLCCSEDAKYFDKNIVSFLSSEAVRKTTDNSWESEPSIADKPNEESGITIKETNNDILQEDKDMQTYYIGYIRKKSGYFNFYPIAKKDDDGLEVIDSDELTALFPKYGSVNLRTESKYNYSYDYLSGLDGIIDDDYAPIVPKLYAVRFTIDMLIDNSDENNQYRLSVDDVVCKGIKIEELIFEAAKLNIYKVVRPDYDSPNFIEGTIKINDGDKCCVGEKVLLHYNQKYYGPFKAQSNRKSEMTIAPNVRTSKTPFIVDYWKDIDLQLFDNTSIFIFPTKYNASLALLDDTKHKQEDLLRDADIIESVSKIVLDSNNDSTRFLNELASNPLFAVSLSEDIIKNRQNRALKLFELEQNRKDILKKFSDGVETNEIVEIFKDRVVSREGLSESDSKINSYEQTIEELEKTIAEKDACIAEFEQKNQEGSVSPVDSQAYQQLDEEYRKLKEEKEQISSDYKSLKEQISSREELEKKISELVITKKLRENDAKEAEEKQKKVKEDADKALSEIKTKMNSISRDMREQVSAAFDPVISSQLIEAAGRFEADTEQNELTKNISAIESLEGNDVVFSGNQEELLNYLVQNIQKFRKYSFNEIINILICCTQNFLTVFSGEPGIGKTSICNIVANSLGLNLFEKHSAPNRFVPVSVEKGWATKRDLIGYYNPLTHRYDKSNSSVYNGLMLLDKEAENSAYPFIILLDEANLSQMEYYWADFMKATDRENDLHRINIGTEKDLVIPKTLRFLATINNDETTVDLSPRLIDRAWIVHLPANPGIVNEQPSSYKSVFTKIIPWKTLCNVFDYNDDRHLDDDSKRIIQSIYKEYEVGRINISPRIETGIERYIVIASSIMEDEPGVSKTKIAIDYAVMQKLLPKISGTYESRESLLERLLSLAENNNLRMTKKAIADAINRHETGEDMGYCRFLV